MTAELRKYGIGVVASHQYLTQVEPQVIDAVRGNAGTIICFRLGPPDAMSMAGEFEPKLEATDLVNLPNHEIYLRLMIDGALSQQFSAVTLRSTDLDEHHPEPSGRSRKRRDPMLGRYATRKRNKRFGLCALAREATAAGGCGCRRYTNIVG
jgi:hypothetical protein